MLANQLARPRGQHGPTPDQAWHDRLPLAGHQRQAFAAALDHHLQELRAQFPIDNLQPQEQAAILVRYLQLAVSSS